MADGFYDDDFVSDEDEKNELNSKSNLGGGDAHGLMPIVELPSATSSHVDSARSDKHAEEMTTDQAEELSVEIECSQEEESDTEELSPRLTSRSAAGHVQRRRRTKSRNGMQSVDMTPPEKLLKKAAKKAKRYEEKNKPDNALKELIRCTALTRIVHGDGHWKLARAHANLANGYFDLKGYAPQAQYHSEIAKSIMMSGVQMSTSSTDKPRIMETLISVNYNLGRALTLQKKYPEAGQALNKAEKLSHEWAKQLSISEADGSHWDTKINLSLARLNARQKNYALASTYFEKVLALTSHKHGKDSVQLIPIYQGLGKVEQSKGGHADQEQAIAYFQQAYSIACARYRDGSIEIAETACMLGAAYSSVGEVDAEVSAESCYNECLAIYLAVYGPNHEKTIEVQDERARLMIRADRQQEGINLLKSSLESKKEVYGELSAQVADTWRLLGNVYLSISENEKGLRALKKCHNIECAVYGSNNRKSKETQRTIDILLANPNLASKQKKSKADELKERPRFNSVGKSGTASGFKPQSTY